MGLTTYTREGRVKDKGGQGPPGGVVVSVYLATIQTLTASTFATVALNAKEYDPYGLFDTSTFRLQPKVPGYYRLSGAWQNANAVTAGHQSVASIWKNGVEAKRGSGFYVSTSTNQAAVVDAALYFNGTTDYAEFRAFSQSVSTQIAASASATYLQAELVAASVGVVPEPWTPIALQNGWTAYNTFPPAFMKDTEGFVRLRGEIAAGTWTAGTTILTLPQGYRPAQRAWFPVYGNSAPWVAILGLGTDGALKVEQRPGTATHIHGLDPIAFKAEQ